QEVEELDDDETYDDLLMMECPMHSQQRETSTELISARNAKDFLDCVHWVLPLLINNFEIDMVQSFDLPNHEFEYLRDLMIKTYDGGIPSEEDMKLLMNAIIAQEKEYNTRSK
ncbi:hypothetical protein KI387_009233, partial [Taxus chinensis]